MIINKLKINGFGKLENKEIELNDKINIIKGDNESGKSTLLKFISSSLYGISRNKNGKDILNIKYIQLLSIILFSIITVKIIIMV